jgi:hypothetical protein
MVAHQHVAAGTALAALAGSTEQTKRARSRFGDRRVTLS